MSNLIDLSQQSISSNLSMVDSYILYTINKIQHGTIKELETIDLQGQTLNVKSVHVPIGKYLNPKFFF
jgi:hypothetical protein